MQVPDLILASSSPRRARLLTGLGLRFEVRPVDVDETLLPGESASEAAARLARLKAVAGARPGALSLGCDTLVEHAGRVLGKPGSPGEAVAMVHELAGKRHCVYTGLVLATPDRTEAAVERTEVWFRALDRPEVAEYVATGEPLDKAGSYGIQGYGAAIVTRVDGDFFNVMGLPVQRLLELFRRFGWRYAFGKLTALD